MQRPRSNARLSFRGLTSFQLHVLARHSEKLHARHYRKLVGLEMRECRIIGIVGSYGEASFKQTREDLNLCGEQVSLLIRRLISQGLLVKVENTTDKRTFKVALTARGRLVHRKLHAAALSLNRQWLSVLSSEQRTMFYDCLETLARSARAMRKTQELHGTPDRTAGAIARLTATG